MNRSPRPHGLLLGALALLWLVPGPARGEAAAPPDLSFAEARLLLARNNRHLMAAADREDARRHERAAARGLRLPSIGLDARATRIDESIVIDLDPIRSAMLALHPDVPPAAVPPFASEIQDELFFEAGLGLTWPVYTGGAISAANRAAEARLGDARAQTRSVEQSLQADLVDRYFGLRLAEQARAVRRQVLDGMERHLRDAERLEEEGMIARAELLHAEVARAEAARALQAAAQDVLLARAALRALLQGPVDPRPTSPLFIVHDLPPLAALVRDAAAANPDLQRLDARRELAESALRAERADYLPDVALFARYELYPEDLTVLDPRWAVGIGLRLELFDGFARRHRVGAARATVSMADHARDAARDDVALLVEHRYRRVVKAVEQYDALASTVELARESLRVRTRAFEEGMATSLEVVDAANRLSGIELARLGAAHDFVASLAGLLAATGQAERFTDYLEQADVEVTP